MWTIEYDPYNDKGFRLFNPLQSCYLASSFRPFPDWDNEHGTDTILEQLQLSVESTCTRAVSHVASTFFIIEGTSGAHAKSDVDS